MDEPPKGENWAHEVKFDGYRIQARIEKGRVQLKTRKGLDWTDRFPEIARACTVLPDGLVDGEICALNAQGASDFSRSKTIAQQRRSLPVFTVRDDLLQVRVWHQGVAAGFNRV